MSSSTKTAPQLVTTRRRRVGNDPPDLSQLGTETPPVAAGANLDDLAQYVQARQAEFMALGRRAADVVYHIGHALSLARDLAKKEGRGRWVKWQEEQGLARQTVN